MFILNKYVFKCCLKYLEKSTAPVEPFKFTFSFSIIIFNKNNLAIYTIYIRELLLYPA